MKSLITIFLCLLPFMILAQTEVTLSGDPNDPKLMEKKKKLEASGFVVKVVSKFDEEEEAGDLAFIKRHTNQSLPDFELFDIDGNKISSQDLKGKKIHINFWSTTCKPCIQEFPELNQLKEKYEQEGFVFLAFAPESKAKVERVLSRFPLNYQIIPAAKAYYETLGIEGYPKNFFIDASGKIIKVTDGTNFKGEMKNGKIVMRPDNFKIYDKIMQEMK